ncbi:MAG TPA: bifunctional metallophosphatase/5'-nucleotidase [Chloroflexia bacterium]|nr:bifunctional metallophosphatase/5'-nucleotidase [Chloroflexia bacterium]
MATAKSGALTIMQINDVHAYLDAHVELFWEGGKETYRKAGGYARIASLVKQAREENPGGVLFTDGGDTLHGTYPAVTTQGRALVPVLNVLGLHAMTAHWEFAYGPDTFRQRASELEYPVLAANIYEKDTGKTAFPSHIVTEVGGLRVGLIGIANNTVDKTMPPSFSEGLRFTSGREELPGLVSMLRGEQRVDLVVLLSHLGFPQDMHLVSEVPGVDVVLSSHTHNRLHRPAVQGSTIVIQSGSHGAFVGRLDLQVEGGKVADYRHRLIEVSQNIEPDAEVAALVRDALEPFTRELGEVVGNTATPLNRATSLESTMDNLLLQALLESTGAQIAISNGWRYGAPIVPGPVTLNDLYNIVPMNPRVSLVELTGEELWAALEENLEHTYSRDPLGQMGGYLKRAMGLRALIRIENPRGHRLQALFVGEEKVEPGRQYTAAFVTEQGISSRYGQNRRHTGERAIDALRKYLAAHDPVRADLRGTFLPV